MAVIGADVDELRRLAAQLDKGASSLESAITVLRNQISSGIQWRGNDADRFRSQWSGQSSHAMTDAAEALRRGASDLRRNAHEQEQASAAVSTVIADGHGAGSAAPSTTAGLLDHIENSETHDQAHDNNNDGVRIERVMGPDGKTRLIVYMEGMGTSPNRDANRGADVIRGGVDSEVIKRIREALAASPDGDQTDIMLVGLSEGAYDAQNIAAHSDELGLHVTNVVAFGAAVTQHDQPGIDTIHLNAAGDPVVGLGQGMSLVDNPGTAMGLIGDQRPNSTNHVFTPNVGIDPGEPWDSPLHKTGYPDVAKDFDNSTDPRFTDAKKSLEKFQGTIIDTYE